MNDQIEASLFPEGTINFFVPLEELLRVRVTFRVAMGVTTLEFWKETHTDFEGADEIDWYTDMSKDYLPFAIPIGSFLLVHKLFGWLGNESWAKKVAGFVEEIDAMSFMVTLPDLLDAPLAETA